jgi:hypothetical protein
MQKTTTHTLLSLGLCLFFVAQAPLTAQNWNQITKGVASDRAASDFFGDAVAISGDYAIVGASLEDEDATGANTADRAGSAYIFKRTGTTWTQEAKIVAPDRDLMDQFGSAVAISGDYAIIGSASPKDPFGVNRLAGAGAAYVFKRTGTTWTQEAKIVASDRAVEDYFGNSVAINGDYAIVGAASEDDDATGANKFTSAGSAYIFKRTGTAWTQEAKIVASDRATFDQFGRSVAISGDYVVVGAWLESENAAGTNTLNQAGSAYIFKRTGTTWTQEAKIAASDRAVIAQFGNSVAISGDYTIIGASGEAKDAAGANTLSQAGAAYIFKRTGTTWAQEAKIVAPDRAVDDVFGLSVAISGDNVLVAAFAEDEDATGTNTKSNAGAAYIFRRTGTTWAQATKIVASDRAVEDRFGSSVAISGEYAIVGASFEDEDATGANTLREAGSVYFFKGTTTPVFETKVTKKLKVYPSVTNGFLTIETTEVADYQVFNLLGQQLLNGQLSQRIDVSALPRGTYILKVGLEQAKFLKL